MRRQVSRTVLKPSGEGDLFRLGNILRTGAQWTDLPDRYPPYQTCHRRFQRWVRDGMYERILEALAHDLKERSKLDLNECYIDATFVVAKKGADAWDRPSGAKV